MEKIRLQQFRSACERGTEYDQITLMTSEMLEIINMVESAEADDPGHALELLRGRLDGMGECITCGMIVYSDDAEDQLNDHEDGCPIGRLEAEIEQLKEDVETAEDENGPQHILNSIYAKGMNHHEQVASLIEAVKHCDEIERDGMCMCARAIAQALAAKDEQHETAEQRTHAAEQLALQCDDQVRDLMSANEELMCENQCSHDEADEIAMLLPEPPNGICDPVNLARNAAKIIGRLEKALEESVKLQSHYAGLLNMHDGGKRISYSNSGAWIARLEGLEILQRENDDGKAGG